MLQVTFTWYGTDVEPKPKFVRYRLFTRSRAISECLQATGRILDRFGHLLDMTVCGSRIRPVKMSQIHPVTCKQGFRLLDYVLPYNSVL